MSIPCAATAPAAVLEAVDLARHYEVRRGFFTGKATVKALAGASFTLAPGKTLAVVGESGCGKSTLARLVTQIERPTAGRLIIDGRDVTRAGAAELKEIRKVVQIVFQDPFGSLNPRKKIGTILEEPLVINTGMTAAERAERAREMMAKVGLRPEHYNRYPHMFSGGQRQRIAIARAMILKPKLVVLDEPTSALDRSVQKQVLALLRELQAANGLTYIFISHDLAVVRAMADEVLVMKDGRVVEQGVTEAIYERAHESYTRALIAAAFRHEAGQEVS